MTRSIIAIGVATLVAVVAILAGPPSKALAKSYQLNVSQVAEDAFRVNAGELPVGTVIFTQGCASFDGPVDATLSWVGDSSPLNQIFFSTGIFCSVADVNPRPISVTPTATPPFDDSYALS